MSMDLRPLALGELLDRAFTVYRRNFRLFVGVMAVPAVLALALALLVQLFQRGRLAALSPGALDPDAALPSPAAFFGFAGGFLVILVAYLAVYMIALGATTVAVSEIYLGRTATIGGAYSRMRGRVSGLMMLMLLVSLRLGAVIVAGSISMALALAFGISRGSPSANILAVVVMMGSTFALGGVLIFMMMRYGVAVPALVLENLDAGAALRRSVLLTRGNLGRVFVVGLLATIVSYAAILLFQGPFLVAALMADPESARAFWFNVGAAVAGTLGSTITGPVLIIGLALLYYDVRIRGEAFDLDLMIAALDQKEQPAVPAHG